MKILGFEIKRSVPIPIRIDHLKRVELKPGDVLLFRAPGPMSDAAMSQVRELLGQIFAGHKVLVLESDNELGVIGREETK